MAANITGTGANYSIALSGNATVFTFTSAELSAVLNSAGLQNFVYINLWNSTGVFQFVGYVNTANIVTITPVNL